MKTFALPDLGEGLAESEIVEWHVRKGDRVEVDQVVVTIETDKAIVEVPAPYSGKIVGLYGEEGDVITVGSLLLEIEEAQETASSGEKVSHSPQSVQKADNREKETETERENAASVVGKVMQTSQEVEADDFWVGSEPVSRPEQLIAAMPSARRLAQQLGADLNRIKGSGRDGVIMDSDVYNYCDKQLPGTEVLKGARRTMVNTMTESHLKVAAVTITEEAILGKWDKSEDISVRLIQAIIYACKKEPALNAWFDEKTMTRCLHTTVNIGIAVDSPQGLYVPVLRHADDFSAKGVRKWLDETVKGIRERKIGREQLQHATITLSNYGAIAGLYATPVVSPPQVAIVGAGRITEKVVMKKGKAVGVNRLPLSITFDHRACTGGEAARFTRLLVKHLEKGAGK